MPAAITYALEIDGAPIDPSLLLHLQQVEVEEHDRLAGMLRLTFAVGVKEDGSGWTLLDDGLFERLTNITLKVTVGSHSAQTLIDAYVIETNVEFSNNPGETKFNVLAMDPSVLMNLEEKVRPWPDMADSDIAAAIFGEYGFDTEVDSTQPSRQETDVTVIQRETDIQFLRRLAQRNGFECYVDVDSASGTVKGHFHPPRLSAAPQGVLSVNLGESTNVESLSVQYDMLRPTTAQAANLDISAQEAQSSEVTALALTALGSTATLNGDRPRKVLLNGTGLAQTGELQTYAQGVVDRAAWAIRAEGELNTLAYEGILRAKVPVLVRGAGQGLSGLYYPERVLHVFAGDEYTQRFTLRRNAVGLSGQESFAQG